MYLCSIIVNIVKKILSYIILTLFLAACGNKADITAQSPPLDSDLLHIDSLMQHDADSALLLLMSFRPERNEMERSEEISPIFNENYRSLLLSEALYKTYNHQSDIAALQSATHYFDSLAVKHPNNDDIIMLSARSHYMNGAIFYENDSIIKACKEYLHTLNIMQNHFENKKPTGYKAKFMGLTYNRLVELFSNKFMMEPAIYCGKKALYFCKIEPTSKYGVANIIYHIGKNYDILGQIDSAYFYYHKAIEQLPDSNNHVYRNIVSNTALLSYGFDYDAEKSINDFKKTLTKINNEEEKLARYIGIGYIYYNEGIYDSAIVYLKYVFDNKSNDVTKFKAAEYLQNIYQSTNDYKEADKYSKFLATNAASKYGNMMEVSALNKLFNDYLEQQKHKQQHQNKKKITYLITIIAVIITCIIIVLIYIKNKKIKEASNKYDKERSKVSKLEQQLVHKRSENEMRIECFLNELVCRKINEMICDIPVSSRCNYSDYPNVRLDEETIVGLGEAVTKHFPNLKTRLLSNDTNLKKDDFLLCYLYLLGLNNSQIALLRQCNFSTVFRQAERLKKSFKGCRNLPNFIKKIAVS